ncbi:MAG TPA: serine/threonine-protein kinase [Myxococcota bacterium]|jgi:hypothetical protein|nr:serine/threonine-protein kinase [Myxococcota bacterium]
MQSCPQCHSQVDSGLRFCPVDGVELTPADKLEGALLGERYRLERRIGEGGMGMVYRGVDQANGENVAVKLLHSEMLNLDQAVRRFRREGTAGGKLDHPHVVRVLDSGQAPDGALFLVMEFVEGESLAGVIHDCGPMDPARVVRIARQVLEALAAAHAEGVIHRDLKPDNIMLCEVDGQPDFAKILDFGIAKVLNDESQDNLTRTGMVFGTPEYMSPEQGVGQKVDHRADLYAAGVVFYQMLCGKRPFEGSDKIAIIAQHISVMPPPPSQRLDGVRLDIPAALEGAVMTALQKKPAERFQTAGDFLSALDLAARAIAATTRAAEAGGVGSTTVPDGGGRRRAGTRLGAGAGANETVVEPDRLRRGAGRAGRSDTTLERFSTAGQKGLAVMGAALRGAAGWVKDGPPGDAVRRIPPDRRPWVLAAAGAAGLTVLTLGLWGLGGSGANSPRAGGDDPPPASGNDATGAPGGAGAGTDTGKGDAKDTPRSPFDKLKPGGMLPTFAHAGDPLADLEVDSPAEHKALDAMRAGSADAVLDALAGAPPDTPAVHYLRGRALAKKGDWAAAKPELLQAFTLAPKLKKDRELVEHAIVIAVGGSPAAAPARDVLEAIGKDGATWMAKAMFEAHAEAERLDDTAASLKLVKKKLTPADQKLLSDARKKRKMLRKVLEKTAPDAVDLRRIWIGELRGTFDCDGRAALIKNIRKAKLSDALPVLEDIQKEGTSLFSGNFCLRGLLPATIKELKGE